MEENAAERSNHHHQQKYMRGEWLNLRLGRKVFYCKFCNRQFYSSQALGGHQNAHKREKTMLQHCLAAATTTTTMSRSLGVHHSHLQKPGVKGADATASGSSSPGPARQYSFDPHFQELQNFADPGSSRRDSSSNPDVFDLHFQDLQNFADPGSYRREEHYSSSNSGVLDLDLKL